MIYILWCVIVSRENVVFSPVQINDSLKIILRKYLKILLQDPWKSSFLKRTFHIAKTSSHIKLYVVIALVEENISNISNN